MSSPLSVSARIPLGRITARRDFLKVQKEGRKWVSAGFILQVSEGGTGLRAGFTVSKRVDRSAVRRNRIRRRLKAVAKDILPVHARTPADYVLIGRPATATLPYETLRKDLVWCLRKMACFRDGEGSVP